jgi:hypothetical protein
MAAPGRPDAESPFIVVQPSRRIAATYQDSLMEPAQRKTLRGEGILGHQDMAATAYHLGLERSGVFRSGGGEWEMYFGRVQTPQLEGAGPIQSVGVGLYKGQLEHLDRRHVVLGVSEDSEKTDRQFRTDLEQITKTLIDRPLLARLMDSGTGRFAAVYPIAAVVTTAAFEGVFLGTSYYSGVNTTEATQLALSKEGLAIFGGIGLFIGAMPTTLISDQLQRLRDRSIARSVPNLGESFADDVAARKIAQFRSLIDGQRVAVEAFGGLRTQDTSLTANEFAGLYSSLMQMDRGRDALIKRQAELPPLTAKTEPSETSEAIVKALLNVREANWSLSV